MFYIGHHKFGIPWIFVGLSIHLDNCGHKLTCQKAENCQDNILSNVQLMGHNIEHSWSDRVCTSLIEIEILTQCHLVLTSRMFPSDKFLSIHLDR